MLLKKQKGILTGHNGVNFIYWTEDKGICIFGGVHESKSSTSQAGWGHDLPQRVALLALTLIKLSMAGKRDTHFSWDFLLPLNKAADLTLLCLTLLNGEYSQSSPSPQCETTKSHPGMAGKGEGEAGFQAYRPQAHHLFHRTVWHLLWNNLEHAFKRRQRTNVDGQLQNTFSFSHQNTKKDTNQPVWLIGNSNFSLLLMSSQETDRSSMPITFIRSPVEKHTSLPEISYIDPETKSKYQCKKEKQKLELHKSRYMKK